MKNKEIKVVNVAIREEDVLTLRRLAFIINNTLNLPKDNNFSVNALVEIAIREYIIKLLIRYNLVNINKEDN